jgi:hypothetical protein
LKAGSELNGCKPFGAAHVRCDCSLRTRLVGDGCGICNPELAAELKWNSEADEYNQWDMLGVEEKTELIAALKSTPDLTRSPQLGECWFDTYLDAARDILSNVASDLSPANGERSNQSQLGKAGD